MEPRERQIVCLLATPSLRFQQSFVKVFYGCHFLVSVSADKCLAAPFGVFNPLGAGACSGNRIAAFLSTLHGTPPQISKGVIPGCQRVVAVALRKRKRAIVAQSLDQSFHAPLCVIGRPL